MVEEKFDREKILVIALRGVVGSAAVSLLAISTVVISIGSSNDEKGEKGEGMKRKKGTGESCRVLSDRKSVV